MVLPEEMLKCKIIASKKQLSRVINTLYDLGLYHITPHVKENLENSGNEQKGTTISELDIGEPLAAAEEMSTLLIKIRGVLAKFPTLEVRNVTPLNKNTLTKIAKGIDNLYEDFIEIEGKRKSFEENEKGLKNKLETLKSFVKLPFDYLALKKSERLCSFYGTLGKKEGLKAILAIDNVSLKNLGDNIFIVGNKKDEEKISLVLGNFAYNPIEIDLSESKDINREIKILESQIEENSKQKGEVKEKIAKIKRSLPILAGVEAQLTEELRKEELPLSFAVTQSSFVAEGWIPKNKKSEVEKNLEIATKEAIHIEFSDPNKKEEPPVKLKNKKLVTPFEFFLNLYDLPKYKEIDPTSYIFIMFPIFFGFMLGDVGYGIVLFALFYFLKKKLNKIPEAVQLSSILMFAALITIIFGFVFGEFFGFEHVSVETGKAWCDNVGLCLPEHTLISHGKELVVSDFPRLLNRAHGQINVMGFEILSVLVIGAIVGFLHLNFGLLVGFINEFRSHGFKHALEAKLSWIILEIGIILAVLSLINILVPVLLWVGIGLAVLGIVLLGIGEGIQGLVEIPALFSNVLSYMRLGAVGLASVGLAVVVNEKLAMPFIEKGGFFIAVGIVIMLMGHIINLLLGIIGPFLHSIRLHYVEFFSKFYHGGGEEYKPFAKQMEIES